MTGTEFRLWVRLRRRLVDGWKFRRQHPIGPFVVDFCCPAAHLVVEVDGPMHDEISADHDERRDTWLERRGYRVIRLSVHDIDEDVSK